MFTLNINIWIILKQTKINVYLFRFPRDKQTWNIEEQFLLGSAFLISPVLYEVCTF
jgi:hypothetical protein